MLHYTYLAHGIKFCLLSNQLIALPTYYIGVRSSNSGFMQDKYATSSATLKRGEWICIGMQLIENYKTRQEASSAEHIILQEFAKLGLLLENMHTGLIFSRKGHKATKSTKILLSKALKGNNNAKGYRHLEKTKKAMSDTRFGENNNFYGKNHAEDARAKMCLANWSRNAELWKNACKIYDEWLRHSKPSAYKLAKILQLKFNLKKMCNKFEDGWNPHTCKIYKKFIDACS